MEKQTKLDLKKIDELKGAVNEKLKALNKKIKEFLDIYDQDNNGEIDVEELIDKRGDLAQELKVKNDICKSNIFTER